jgi:hypothetical protein
MTWSMVVRRVVPLGIVLACLWFAAVARADVRLEGDWKEMDRSVTLDVSATPRGKAIELLAEAAGFSVVMSSPLSDLVDVHVKDQPASKVLSLLLPDGTYVARRSGSLVSIQSLSAEAAAPPPAAPPTGPSAPPSAATTGPGATKAARGEDRNVFGGSLTLNKDEVVHDLAVFGGNLDVYGTVTGDLAVLGGYAHMHDGAKVLGSASVLGGELRVDDGAKVEHDVSVIGGHLDRGAHAKVGHVNADDDADDDADAKSDVNASDRRANNHGLPAATRAWRAVRHWGDDALSSLSAAALLFVFGAVVIALATERSQALRVEIAARPMRTFALGVVGGIAAIAVTGALCVTLIGIPVAIVGVILFIFAAYAGVAAALTTAGEALLRHRATSSYVHLAAGCALYFLVGLIPWVGRWATIAVFLVGVGVMVATRCAGLIPAGKKRLGAPQGFADV